MGNNDYNYRTTDGLGLVRISKGHVLIDPIEPGTDYSTLSSETDYYRDLVVDMTLPMIVESVDVVSITASNNPTTTDTSWVLGSDGTLLPLSWFLARSRKWEVYKDQLDGQRLVDSRTSRSRATTQLTQKGEHGSWVRCMKAMGLVQVAQNTWGVPCQPPLIQRNGEGSVLWLGNPVTLLEMALWIPEIEEVFGSDYSTILSSILNFHTVSSAAI